MPTIDTDGIEQNIFEERAERLSRDELQQWTALTEIDKQVIEKLKGPGVKLLRGPRGSGKSTLLKFAYYESLDSEQVLPVYVNYSHSLALEPLFHSHANALRLFRQWLLLKIIVGVQDALRDVKASEDKALIAKAALAKQIIRDLERGVIADELDLEASPSELIEFLETTAINNERSRCVLLLDDAAHAFSIEQQREFFEVFRQLRSRRVACKAAIYPGITSFSHSFNVGHEAEIIEAWYDPGEEYYLPLMRRIVSKRLGSDLQRLGPNIDEYVTVLALAASGQPRGFLNMLSEVIGDPSAPKAPTRRKVMSAVEEYATYVDGVFRSLGDKFPRYGAFVVVGEEVKNQILSIFAGFNKGKLPEKRTQAFGLKEPISDKLEKILQFLEYSGIVRKLRAHSRGKIGSYQRYQLHSAVIYAGGGVGLGQTFTTAELVKSISNFDPHEYCKVSPSKLLQEKVEALALNLPPCTICGAVRLSAEQKFCMKCGTKLTEASLYQELLRKPISALSIPQKKKDGILKHTQLRTIQDIILDDKQTILEVPRIGKVWGFRIRNLAEEYVGV